MDSEGYFIPFTRPIPDPGEPATEVPDTCLSFNSAWLSAIMGALKPLARPETWQGEAADGLILAREGHTLMGHYGRCRTPEDFPNWNLDFGGLSFSPFAIIELPETIMNHMYVVAGVFGYDAGLTVPRVGWEGFTTDSNPTNVGGPIIWQSYIWSNSAVYTYTYVDIFGSHVVTDTGNALVFEDVSWKRFVLDVGIEEPVCGVVIIASDWTFGDV